MNQTIVKICFLTIGFAILACAKQMPPPGGPVDTIPPEVIRIIPSPGEINVATHTAIEIDFNEQMNRKTVEDAIFISPWPSEEINFGWKRKRLKIEFGDTLKENRTYVLTIGAKSSDLRNNKLTESFSMAFSTGDHIDEGQISGAVYSNSGVEGTLVCAYLLVDSSDVDPGKVLADYYTQCNQQGGYRLQYVAPGNYRLFAIKDRDGNRKYTRGIDGLGITTSDVILTQDEQFVQDINFQLTVEDTVFPSIRSAYSINQSNVVVRFSEALLDFNEGRSQDFFTIFVTNDTTKKLNITSFFNNSLDPSNIFLLTERQLAVSYQLIAQNFYDQSNNPLDSSNNSVVFDGTIEPDTVQPTIIFRSIQDSSFGISLNPEIRFGFSEAIDQNSFEKSFNFKENDTSLVSGKFNWKNPADVTFLIDSSLRSLTQYRIEISIVTIVDLAGNSLADTVDTLYFKTLNADTLSAIGGEVIDEQENAKGKMFLTAKSEQNSYQLTLDNPGDYLFESVMPGIYTIYGFRDSDSNGVYSFGQSIPYVPSERFVFYADSIKVRSRWPNDGNDITLK